MYLYIYQYIGVNDGLLGSPTETCKPPVGHCYRMTQKSGANVEQEIDIFYESH